MINDVMNIYEKIYKHPMLLFLLRHLVIVLSSYCVTDLLQLNQYLQYQMDMMDRDIKNIEFKIGYYYTLFISNILNIFWII